jgi:hypothetical protein
MFVVIDAIKCSARLESWGPRNTFIVIVMVESIRETVKGLDM